MIRQRFLLAGTACVLTSLLIVEVVPAAEPEPGQATGFTAGSPYSYRPLDRYWSYYAPPPPSPRYDRFGDSPIFMTSINYPGVYGAYVFGVTPTSYYDSGKFFVPGPESSTPSTFKSVYAPASPFEPDNPMMRTTVAPQYPFISSSATAALRTRPVYPELPVGPGNSFATITVRVPTENADLTFNGFHAAPIGAVREFSTPKLIPGSNYMYNVRVTWVKDGLQRTRDKNVFVNAGDRLDIDLTTSRGAIDGPTVRLQPAPEPTSSLRTLPLPSEQR